MSGGVYVTVDAPVTDRTITPPTGRESTALALGIAITLGGVIPVFLVTGMAVQIQADLGLTASRLGLAVTAYFLVASVGSMLAGRMTHGLGAARAAPVSSGLAIVALVGLATLTDRFAMLVLFLAIAGVASAMAHPSANLTLLRHVGRSGQGLAFGVKQAAVPAGSFLGGAAVPVVALTLGWRWAFGIGVVLAMALCVVVLTVARPYLTATDRPVQPTVAASIQSRRTLVLLCLVALLGTTASNSLATFLAVAGVHVGLSPARAGILLSVASLTGIAMRVVVGRLADRALPDPLRTIRAMLLVATLAMGVLATSDVIGLVPLFVVAAIVGFGATWGWHGLLTFAIMRRHPEQAAVSTGWLQGAIGGGGVVGPVSVGFIIDRWSFPVAWAVEAIVLAVAVAVVTVVHRQDGHAFARAASLEAT